MKIVDVRIYPLTGGTVDGGWPQGHEPQEDLHTFVEVVTDSGPTGWGSCFTSGPLVAGAMRLLWPLMEGASAIEPERTTETLRQSTFWQGRGGAVEHAISGVDLCSGTFSGRRADSRFRGCWAASIARASSRTVQFCLMSRISWHAGSKRRSRADFGRLNWAGAPSGGGAGGSMSCSCGRPAKRLASGSN